MELGVRRVEVERELARLRVVDLLGRAHAVQRDEPPFQRRPPAGAGRGDAAERRREVRDEGLHLVDRALVEAQRVHGRDEVLDALGDARRVDRVALLQVRRRRAHAQQPVARARAVDAPLREERLGARDRAVARQRGLARAELGHELAARRLVVGRGHGAPRVRLLHGLAGLEQGIKVRQVRLAPPLPRARVEGGVGHLFNPALARSCKNDAVGLV